MSIAWHPTEWWGWCLSEDEKKELDPMFPDKVEKC